jgi:CelD/BcsL family acetyltransferase involved in cellulose biosynthesis
MLNHLPADSPVLAGLRRSLGARALVPVREQHRVFELPREPEAVLGHLSRKHRYNARREDRLLVEHFGGDVRLRTFTGAEQLPALLAGAAEIYDRSYQAGIGGGFRKASVWTRILEVEARLGRLRGYLLEASGRGVAFQVGVVYGGTYHLEATAYLPDWRSLSPGSVLLRRVLEDLVAAKIGKVDYGFGDADYKRTYSTSVREEETLHAYARTVPALAALALDRVALGVASGSRALVERAGGVRALKRRWRRAAERRDRS